MDNTVYNLAPSVIQSVPKPSGSVKKGFLEGMYVEGPSRDGAGPGRGGRSQGSRRLGTVTEQASRECRQPTSRQGGETLMPTLILELGPWGSWELLSLSEQKNKITMNCAFRSSPGAKKTVFVAGPAQDNVEQSCWSLAAHARSGTTSLLA